MNSTFYEPNNPVGLLSNLLIVCYQNHSETSFVVQVAQ